MLLDFGASRQTLTQDAPKLFPMYTPGFAAPELYRRNQHLGPWTDIYGMGATMFACLVGSPPQPADQRVLGDKVEEALHEVAGLYSQQLIDIVCWCLKLNPLERPQSVFVLQKALRAAHVSVQAVPSTKAGGISRWLDGLTSRRRRSVRQDTTLMWSTQKAPH
jgi:serine/threonine protein kinase